jgi:hypothetical protein
MVLHDTLQLEVEGMCTSIPYSVLKFSLNASNLFLVLFILGYTLKLQEINM